MESTKLHLITKFIWLVLGYTNLGDCPIREEVPLYCLISGSLALTGFVCFFISSCHCSCCEKFWFGYFIVCALAHFGVQCWGCKVIFRYWSEYSRRESYIVENNLCDKDTFLMSFATLIMYWIVSGGLFCIYCCVDDDWKLVLLNV